MAAKPVCKVDAKICAWTDKIVGVKPQIWLRLVLKSHQI